MSDWLELVRPGDLVVVAQGTGEPTPLLERVLADAPADVEVFVGLSHSDALTGDAPIAPTLLSFGAMGPLGRPPRRGSVEVIPAHFDDLPRVLPRRGRDIVLLVATAPDDGDGHSLGVSVDYTWDLCGRARAVVAEVNASMPVTSAPRLPASALAATVATSRPLPAVAAPEPGDTQTRIAEHVAAHVPAGATLQLGVGGLAAAVATALRGHRDLAVRSTLAGDWLLGLAAAGALRERDAVVLAEAAGSPALHAWVAGGGADVRPVGEVAGPAAAGEVDRFVAVNAALQVDLTGQVNAETLPAGYVGGIGGQAEFLRAAQRSPGGVAVIGLPATAGRHSRIVPCLADGTVTTPRSTVDLVVTEHGVADLRGRSLRERTEALIAVAAPEHRDTLRRGARP